MRDLPRRPAAQSGGSGVDGSEGSLVADSLYGSEGSLVADSLYGSEGSLVADSLAEGGSASIPPVTSATLDSQRFLAVRTIGAGAMGRVDLVHDRRLLRDVAWKRGDARLLREARVLAQLEHPGIVPIHDMGFDLEGQAWFAMRVVRGQSLADMLRDLAQNPGQSHERRMALARSLQRAAEAVAYAHHRGVVHRDLKPANIMIGDFGEAQVVDWGLATVLSDSDDPIAEPARLALAGFESGRVGTPGYMSPEQEEGLAVDRRSDVYGLGRILERIFLLGGSASTTSAQTPVIHDISKASSQRNSRGASKAAARSSRPSPMPLAPEIIAIIERATAHRPEQRYPDARAFASDLGHYLDGGRVSAYTYRPGELFHRFVSTYRVPLTVALAGLVLALILIALYVVDVGHERAQAEKAEAATRQALARSDQMLSRALVGEARRLDQMGARPEAEVLAAHSLALSENPDARGVLSALGAPSIRLVSRMVSPCREAEVDVVGRRLMCVAADRLSLHALGSHETTLLWTRQLRVQLARLAAHGIAVASDRHILAFDLTGKEILRQRSPINFTRRTGVDGDEVLFESAKVSVLVDVDTRQVTPLSLCPQELHSATLLSATTPGLAATICKSGVIYLAPQTTASMSLDVGPSHGQTPLDIPIPTPFSAPEREVVRMAASGGRLVVGTIKGEVAVLDMTGKPHATHTLVNGMVRILAVSPDGRYIAVAGEGDPIQIATYPGLARLTALPRRARTLAWDPTRKGELITTGSYIERWRLDDIDQSRPLGGAHNIGLLDGVVSVESDLEREDRLALAFGPYGAVIDSTREVHVHTGLVTAKAATVWGDTVLVAGINGGAFREVVSMAEIHASPEGAVRRAVTLTDGLPVVAGYSWLGRLIDGHEEPLERAEAFDLSASPGRMFAVYVRQADRMIMRVRAGQPISEEVVVDLDTEAVAISADGEHIYSAHPDEVVIWDSLGRWVGVHRAADSNLIEVAVSGDGRWVAAGTREGTVLLWRTGDLHPVARFFEHRERVPALTFSRDSRWLATGSWDRSLRIRNLERLETPPRDLIARFEKQYRMDLAEALGGDRVE